MQKKGMKQYMEKESHERAQEGRGKMKEHEKLEKYGGKKHKYVSCH